MLWRHNLFKFWLLPSPLVPCVPHNVSAVKHCGNNSITMTWGSSSALFYVVMAEDSNGVIHICNSMTLTCTIKDLMCGTNYTVYAIASNFQCNSTESEMLTVATGTMKLLVFSSSGCFIEKLLCWFLLLNSVPVSHFKSLIMFFFILLVNFLFVLFQLLAHRMKSPPLLTVQPVRLWFHGAMRPMSTPTPPPSRMKMEDFSAAAPLLPAAGYPTWSVDSSTLPLSTSMMAFVKT